MKVLMIGPSLSSRGGIVSVMKNLSDGLKDSRVTCLHHSVGFDCTPLWKALRYVLSFPLFVFLKLRHHVDVVHAHPSERWGFYRYVPYIFMCKIFRIPILLHMHGGSFRHFFDETSLINKWIIMRTLGHIDGIICLSDYWRKFFDELTNVRKFIIPNSVRVFNENKYNVLTDGIVFLGFIEQKKGVFDLLQAFSALQNIERYTLHICGSGETELIRTRIEYLDLQERVVVHGWVSEEERMEIFGRSKLFVLPSYFEALPMSLLEAMSFGLPVVVTNVGSMPEVVDNGINGKIVTPGDIRGLTEALSTLLSDDKLLCSMSQKNFIKIHSTYSIESSVRELQRVYSDTLLAHGE